MPPPAHLFIITGASRGFGRSLALALAERPSPSSFLLLGGRSADALERAAADVRRAAPDAAVAAHPLDLSDASALPGLAPLLAAFLPAGPPSQPPLSLTLVHNAGTLGPLQPVSAAPHLPDLLAATTANLTSYMYLSSLLLSLLPPEHVPLTQLINVSSLAARKPFPTWSVYCALKAARDMHLSTAAAELHGGSALRGCLSYAPGPMDTDMQGEIRGSGTCDAGTREYFKRAKEGGELVDPDVSAAKLAGLIGGKIGGGGYETGTHVDFYDV
ncbi:hypothetical protein TeGR_g4245 [Tetraparma gracilis]|uniref:Sepiapterin reductase n=1 Tax=Tetraparma gracilis TaxID=2962635 RepID=A0ABQ6NA76_9STRA|nr:hypothetical protein TeGR_g4245 [Tetraparma gracilis]